MEGKIIVRENVVSPWFKEYPFEETEKWGAAYRANIPKTKKAIVKDVSDPESFNKNRAQPVLAAIDKMLNPNFISRKGLPKEVIIAIAKAKLSGKNTARKYKKNVNRGYRTFDQGDLNSAMVGYHLSQSFGEYRFKDAIEKALGWLLPFIQPCLPAGRPAQGKFRLKFGNQVERSGKLISKLAYDPKYIKPEDDKINRLINEYIREGIVPFETFGDSHCDFYLIPESVTPADSKKVKEIKYEIYKHFLGEEQAKKLRAIWIIKDYPTPPDPNDYLGNHIDPHKQAYFDMELDVQVTRKK